MSRQALHPSLDAGPAVRYLRNRKGWSQRELAHAAGVTGTWLSQVEGGKRQPSWALVRRFGDALEVTDDEFDALVADRPWVREALPVSEGTEWTAGAVAGAPRPRERMRAASASMSTDLARELGELCAHYVECTPAGRQLLMAEARRLATGG